MLTTIDTIEADFLARRRRPPELAGAFGAAWARIEAGRDDGGAEGEQGCRGALARTGQLVAHAIDAAAAAAGREPAYHNRHHMAEATLAMGLLCQAALQQGLITGIEAAVGLVGMVGHDMGHDGSTVGGGVLERRSSDAVAPIAVAAGLDGHVLDALADVILATDVTLAVENAERLAGGRPPGRLGRGQDVLRVLANEADIFGSMLPRLGPMLSRALAEEWRPSGDPALARVGTAAGRLEFLRACPPLSGPAVALGLCVARARCFEAWAAAGERLGAGATPEAGCAALDRLAPMEAAAVYGAALG